MHFLKAIVQNLVRISKHVRMSACPHFRMSAFPHVRISQNLDVKMSGSRSSPDTECLDIEEWHDSISGLFSPGFQGIWILSHLVIKTCLLMLQYPEAHSIGRFSINFQSADSQWAKSTHGPIFDFLTLTALISAWIEFRS